MASIELKDISKEYEGTQVIENINLEIEKGEFVVFVGPSGCGKSTMLRMIAGLEEITGGEMYIGEQLVNEVHPSKRDISMVFQSYALYPHMTVYNNLAFGLKMKKIPKDEIDRRVKEAAKILELEKFLERHPKALSGGQRQRVAIGRAIVRNPLVFLFDEPLSNLDAALRHQTRIEIAKLHQELQTTMVYVTHDQVEAMTLASRIVVMNHGNIQQVGTPLEVYNRPANKFVASFIGNTKMNFIPIDQNKETLSHIKLPKKIPNGTYEIGIRPEDLTVVKSNAKIDVTASLCEQMGECVILHSELNNKQSIVAKLTEESVIEKGLKIGLSFNDSKLNYFGKDGQALYS